MAERYMARQIQYPSSPTNDVSFEPAWANDIADPIQRTVLNYIALERISEVIKGFLLQSFSCEFGCFIGIEEDRDGRR